MKENDFIIVDTKTVRKIMTNEKLYQQLVKETLVDCTPLLLVNSQLVSPRSDYTLFSQLSHVSGNMDNLFCTWNQEFHYLL